MRIQNKLFVSWLCSSALLITSMVLLLQWSVDRGMLEYVNERQARALEPVVEALAEQFRDNQDWAQFEYNPRQLNHFIHQIQRRFDDRPLRAQHPRPEHRFGKRRGDVPHGGGRHDDERFGNEQRGTRPGGERPRPPPPRTVANYSLFSAGKILIAGKANIDKQILIPIMLDGSAVAWLGMRRQEQITEIFELQFLQNTRQMIVLAGLFMIALSVLFTLPLARHFVAPIKKIAAFVHDLSRGNFDASLRIDRSDEFSTLARDVSELSATLKENDSVRKRWLADTSHELRTPLAILRGEIEAMIDGVRPLDQHNMDSLHQETIHLGKLVDDLYELSSADIGGLRYQKSAINLQSILEQQVQHYQTIASERTIDLRLIPGDSAVVYADDKRIRQLIDNLLDNACKYTDRAGLIEIGLTTVGRNVVLLIEDSAPGVAAEHLDKLFEHLFRVDDSRNRSTGGSGLGLAIVQRIVDAHQGTITTSHSKLGGLCIAVTLPR